MHASQSNTNTDNMWKCAVLLSVCYLGLAVAQALTDDSTDCGENEYLEKCTYECPPEKTCENRLVNVFCPAVVMPCIAKCICKEGYFRDGPGGKCISEKECGPACGENEEYKECINPCVDESCEGMGSLKSNCTCPEPCEPGCACKEGFYKIYGFLCTPKCYCPQLRDTAECRN